LQKIFPLLVFKILIGLAEAKQCAKPGISERRFHHTRFGVSRVVCGAHLRLPCAMGHAATLAVIAALVASQWQHRANEEIKHQQ